MLKSWKSKIDETLPRLIPLETPDALKEAMLYSLTAGGKRFRPLLLLAAAHAFGRDGDDLVPAACALEFIHTYSLIHDDLPAMDDDALRRGKPTSHIVFGEALAILAGDALNTEAFHILAIHPKGVKSAVRLKAVEILAAASGPEGMAGGQVLDMEEDREVTEERLHAIHAGKTGRLIQAAILMGALYAGREPDRELRKLGLDLGLLFQLTDDILDEIATADEMGKATGKDREMGKITAPVVFGLDEAVTRAHRMKREIEKGMAAIEGPTGPLEDLAALVTKRLP